MPRYKKSAAERAAEKERRERNLNFVHEIGAEGIEDLKDVYKMKIVAVLEGGLEAELDEQLGYSKYDYRNKEVDNSRNGFSKKTLKTSFVDTEISVPRDRNGEFEPQLVKKNQTTLTGDIEEKI